MQQMKTVFFCMLAAGLSVDISSGRGQDLTFIDLNGQRLESIRDPQHEVIFAPTPQYLHLVYIAGLHEVVPDEHLQLLRRVHENFSNHPLQLVIITRTSGQEASLTSDVLKELPVSKLRAYAVADRNHGALLVNNVSVGSEALMLLTDRTAVIRKQITAIPPSHDADALLIEINRLLKE